MLVNWKDIKDAPKDNGEFDGVGPWIFARNKYGEYKVIRWSTEYPYDKGVWTFAYEPEEYIDGLQEFYGPVEWDYLPNGESK